MHLPIPAQVAGKLSQGSLDDRGAAACIEASILTAVVWVFEPSLPPKGRAFFNILVRQLCARTMKFHLVGADMLEWSHYPWLWPSAGTACAPACIMAVAPSSLSIQPVMRPFGMGRSGTDLLAQPTSHPYSSADAHGHHPRALGAGLHSAPAPGWPGLGLHVRL